MGYFDGLSNSCFKKDADGWTVFFPYGPLGKGRFLPDERTEQRARLFVTRYYQVSIPLIVGVGAIFGWAWNFALLPVLWLWYFVGSRSIVSACAYSDEKLMPDGIVARAAAVHKKSALWRLFILSLVFVAGGVFGVSSAVTLSESAMAWASTIFFGVFSIVLARALKRKYA